MMRAMTQRFTCLAAASLLAACAPYERAAAPLDAKARTEVWPLSVEAASQRAAPSAPHSPGKGRAALAGAGMSIAGGAFVGSGVGPVGTVIGAGLGIALAPFVALGVALATPSSERLQEANAAIAAALTETRWDAALKEAVENAVAEHGQQVARGAVGAAGRLKLSLQEPWLVVDGFNGLPTLTVHGELAKGETCLMDRSWRWNGKSDRFVYLADYQAQDYRAQMEKGLATLAEAVVADLLALNQARATRYADKETFERGGLPLVVSQPFDARDQVGSWDDTKDTRCSGLREAESVPMEPLTPPKQACHTPGCRVAG